MRNILIVLLIILMTTSATLAYAIKVYDEYGNRVGTYKKEGENYQLYDFYDKKVDNPDDLIQNAPDRDTLKEYSRTFYDENMIPIGSLRSGLYSKGGSFYPRGTFYPTGEKYYFRPTPYIVRPSANHGLKLEKPANIRYTDTRFPSF